MDQEALEANVPIAEEAVVQATEVVGEADNKEEEEEEAQDEAPVITKSRKRAARPSPVIVPPPIADHKFWSDMLATKRELDRTDRNSRFANLVKF